MGAGSLGHFHPLLDYPTDDFDAIQAVNVRGAVAFLLGDDANYITGINAPIAVGIL